MLHDSHPNAIDDFLRIIREFILLADDGEISTRHEVVRHLDRFQRWCHHQGIVDISAVRQEDVEAFVYAPTSMGGRVRRPRASTIRNRKSAVGRVFRASRQLGYELFDPTIDIVLVYDRLSEANLCDERDISRLREGAPIGLFDATHAVLLALAEAGATNSEAKDVVAEDIDLTEGIVRLRGNARVDERVNSLTEWGAVVVAERLSRISNEDFLVANAIGLQCSEATISQMFRHIASYANLGSKGFNINSVRGWRARKMYAESGRIQDAALFLGNRSLDSTASLIGLEWRESA